MGNFHGLNLTPLATKLLMNKTVQDNTRNHKWRTPYIPDYSKTRKMIDSYFAAGILGRFGAYESVDKDSNGKEYPYVGYYDKWDNEVVGWLGGKAPEIAGKIYYDPETKEPLNPQPVIGVDQAYRSYVDSLNDYYQKNHELKEFKWQPSILGKLFGLGMAPNTEDVPSNVALYYARQPLGYELNENDLINSWSATPTWGQTYAKSVNNADNGMRADLHALALGVPASYRKQRFEEIVKGDNGYSIYHKESPLKVSYYKPRGHTGKGDAPYYFSVPEDLNGLLLDSYFTQKAQPPDQESYDKAIAFDELTNPNNGLGLERLRPKNYVSPERSTKESREEYFKMINSDPNSELYGKHWYSPRFLVSVGIGIPHIIQSYLAAQRGENGLNMYENMSRQIDEEKLYNKRVWNPIHPSEKSKVTHYFE